MCGYTGSHFGASYPDAACDDGYLWDLDGDGPSSADTTPCPQCNTAEWLDDAANDAMSAGVSMGTPWCGAMAFEGALALAETLNPAGAGEWKAAHPSLAVADWPDREAVFEGRARWDETCSRVMVLAS